MELYLIRHGLAGEFGSYPDDRDRPLTEAGKKKTQLVAERLKTLSIQFDQVLSSPFARAWQTAEILLQVGLSNRLEVADYLAPAGEMSAWLDWLLTWKTGSQGTLALVGHEPDLSRWAEILLWGEYKGVITLKKAGVIGLAVPDSEPVGNASLFWLTPPRLLL
jgi:phosphohistidine phosphatase